MRILIATSEAVPYVKTGGLADVSGALVREYRKNGLSASLIMPLYSAVKERFKLHRTGKNVEIVLAGARLSGEIWKSEKSPVPEAYFVECDGLYSRPELYGTPYGDYPDNALRFAFFSRAVVEASLALGIKPDIIHCNDWQTGLVPLYLKTLYSGKEPLSKTASLFTIHNLGYQGLFDPSEMKYTGLGTEYFTPGQIEFYGKVNFMKAGLLHADLISTVSETYASEILKPEHGFGLDGILRMRRSDLFGVLNGIDYSEWDPANDSFIPCSFSADDRRGKAVCRRALLKETGLAGEKAPLFAVVSRLSAQKGVDLLSDSVDSLVAMGANLVFLGKGDEHFQDLLRLAARRHPRRVFVEVGFGEALAHRIYAGSDFFLMPSRYEPCGLGQLISLRYGTLPVARRTGGLADTISDFDHLLGKGDGFLFDEYTPSALQGCVKRALCVFGDRPKMQAAVFQGMQADFSWRRSADRYLDLYERAARKARA